MADPARSCALAALFSFDRGGAYADAAIKEALDAAALSPRDAAFATQLFYKTVEMRLYIDYQLAPLFTIRLKKLHPAVLEIARLGAAQILFLDSVPASAAVNTSVELCRARGMSRATGLLNAVLRRLAAEGPRPVEGEGAERLSIAYSHPLWLTKLFLSRFGEEGGRALLAADNGAPPTSVRVNTLKAQPDSLRERLDARGIRFAQDREIPVCGTLADAGRLDALPEFVSGELTAQDKASVAAVLAADPKPGERVLDLCAAPGGKSFCAAARMENRGEILASDLHPHKAELLRAGARRLGVTCLSASVRDATVYDPALSEAFDLVIADVPCSGLGVVRKKPDLRYKDPASFPEIEETQRRIAENAARYVRPGGRLLYATCTLREEENERMRAHLLQTFPSLSPLPFRVSERIHSEEGQITLLPHLHGTDGFYFAVFRKN